MVILPAVDLLEGRVVRLRQGDYRQATVYGEDPVDVARRWRAEGAEWLHVVDLDGARGGRPRHLAVVARIAAEGVRVQFGGGLRREEDLVRAFEAGVARAVLGTAALRDLRWLEQMTARFGDRIAVALDVRGDRVMVEGWQEEARLPFREAAVRCLEAGARRLVVTDVGTDGMLAGPNLELFREAMALGVPVLASGGIRNLEDLRALRRLGVEGAIVGRAIYEGTLSVSEALQAARE
ncbi:MAG: 1-(5-phosphoribosyl)-5-[(5-phosphoribosylamino)methylideneamino]imidazole-4-carboxamide isomerase [Armatimonadota bacterium]|nr:1-(5-phosphoribosyl)-5-[(5-phosphoribosylamino)methylideneamino]imidazole-4-carboxamide isomerase [Armatimonadota bacterium]MDR7569261.1 1-(5-phosphoribosyl)-5-[(5-phosphoribosylamino)methylideneamino]imidazole-4-carboxamide isomerase [Armatimonadota bacterium]MDR7614921.1 1-(5-phosphoribosyl)-5-[(5-phosphoribosylamino)methylideneamino]imidazole-4-carboxamide isomerase [Armatimonadota bacterium]